METCDIWVPVQRGEAIRTEAPRRSKRNAYNAVSLKWLECVEDFAGNSCQPGCWADMWQGSDMCLYLSTGGFWEAHVRPNRHRVRRLHRYASFRRVTRMMKEGDVSRILRSEWLKEDPANPELPPVDYRHKPRKEYAGKSESQLEAAKKRAAGTLTHPEALIRCCTREELVELRAHFGKNPIMMDGLSAETENPTRYGPTTLVLKDGERVRFRTQNFNVFQRMLLNRFSKQQAKQCK